MYCYIDSRVEENTMWVPSRLWYITKHMKSLPMPYRTFGRTGYWLPQFILSSPNFKPVTSNKLQLHIFLRIDVALEVWALEQILGTKHLRSPLRGPVYVLCRESYLPLQRFGRKGRRKYRTDTKIRWKSVRTYTCNYLFEYLFRFFIQEKIYFFNKLPHEMSD